MKKYRLIKELNNACQPPWTTWVIEKRVKFLFWSWWSQNYLYDGMGQSGSGHYDFTDADKAKNMLDILNGKKEWVNRTIVQ